MAFHEQDDSGGKSKPPRATAVRRSPGGAGRFRLTGRAGRRLALAGCACLLVSRAWTFEDGPLPNHTGAPGEATCAASECHSTFPLNSGPGVLTLTGAPDRYVAGARYTLTVQVFQEGQSRWGFEATTQDRDGRRAGSLLVTDASRMQIKESLTPPAAASTPQYVEHTLLGTAAGTRNRSPLFQFDWVAPPKGSGDVTFYVAANAANGDGKRRDDYIYAISAKSVDAQGSTYVEYGDIDGDGKINVKDATLSLRIAVGLLKATSSELRSGDVAPAPGVGPKDGRAFGDGKINVADTTRILQRSVGILRNFNPPILPPPAPPR